MRPNEYRALRGTPVEVRGKDARAVGGYALKFNALSQNLGGFVERIDPGFLAKSEGDGWPGVMARWNHDDAYLLGTTEAGTLRLVTDGTGLEYEVDTPQARADLLELVARGDVTRSSFAFRTIADDWGLTPDGFPLRTLLSGQLVDVAPVNTPAYMDTSTGLRSLAEAKDADLDEIRALAEAGELGKLFTRSDTPTEPPAPGAAESTPNPVIPMLRRHLELSK
jgi:uncharacterized protein